jgi:hypothetical protein
MGTVWPGGVFGAGRVVGAESSTPRCVRHEPGLRGLSPGHPTPRLGHRPSVNGQNGAAVR